LGDVVRVGVIVAAGQGARMGEDKVWMPLGGIPVVAHSIRAFAACTTVSRIVVVVSPRRIEQARALLAGMGIAGEVREGGKRRQDSVLGGLEAAGEAEYVAIHDGARPLVTARLIEQCFEAAEESGAAIAAVPVRDTVKRASTDGWIAETVDRTGLWAAQTPQAFRVALLRRAYESVQGEVTDEAAALERIGQPVRIVRGDPANIKLTTREDLALAEALMEGRRG
jgi:2-C-methyl-D-erythritol 4-phosphate cytidylyltransferase